jgi:peptidoglycan hydrolase-like protein with peptidoglycan-binding domain
VRVKKKPDEPLDIDAPETLSAGPLALLSSVLIALMSSAILYNLIWRQHGQLEALRADERQPYVEIIAGEPNRDPSRRTHVTRTKGSDELIAAVQEELLALGLFQGPPDGIAGAKTRAAVLAYQRKNALPATGRADRRLLEHMRFTGKLISASDYTNTIAVAPGEETAAAAGEERVRRIQKGLAALGYRPGAFDGFLGQQTRDAIRQFEGDRGWTVTGEISAALVAELSDIGAFAEP